MSNLLYFPDLDPNPPEVYANAECDNGCPTQRETWLYQGRVVCMRCGLPAVLDLNLDELDALGICDLISARDILGEALDHGELVEPAFRVLEITLKQRTGAWQGTP